MSEPKPRITSYIRSNFGEDVLAEVVAGKRTVSLNGIVLDATTKNFRDKRVTVASRVEISDTASSYDVIVTENAIDSIPKIDDTEIIDVPIETPELITETPIPVEIPTLIEIEPVEDIVVTPIEPVKIRTKRCYNTLKHGKPAPEGARVFISKSGKQYYMKVIGEDRYITE